MTKPAAPVNTCATCACFVPGKDGGATSGECRRYPPTAELGFPRTAAALWCGEWSAAQ